MSGADPEPTAIEPRAEPPETATAATPRTSQVHAVPAPGRHVSMNMSVMQTAWSSNLDLPPPEMIAAYNAALPGLAERLVSQMEQESKHRRDTESLVVAAQISASTRNSWLGFAVAMAGLVTAGVTAYLGHPITAGVIGGVDLLAILASVGRASPPTKDKDGKKA